MGIHGFTAGFRRACVWSALVVGTAACIATGQGPAAESNEPAPPDGTFGAPAVRSEADRTIEVQAAADNTFVPGTIAVSEGEAVTFEITNTDTVTHDFTIGDEAAQIEHGAEMQTLAAEQDTLHADPNSVTVPAGQMASITWRFTRPGTVLYGCHEPGHYERGMVGSIEVLG